MHKHVITCRKTSLLRKSDVALPSKNKAESGACSSVEPRGRWTGQEILFLKSTAQGDRWPCQVFSNTTHYLREKNIVTDGHSARSHSLTILPTYFK
jgi:hypothetical protein